MTTLAYIIDAMMVSDSPADTGSLERVEFWHTELGHIDILAITPPHTIWRAVAPIAPLARLSFFH